MVTGASEIDPLVGVIDPQYRLGTSRELERNTPVLSQVLFHSKDNIEVEELYESIATPNSPLPLDYPDVLLYVRTPTIRPSSSGLYRYFPSITIVGSMASTISATSMKTLISVQGGGTISIPSITHSTSIFGSTSIPSSSGSSQVVASSIGFFSFGIVTSKIILVPLSIQSVSSTSMASGSTYFQGFQFRGGHIPHSNPTLGSMPFSSTVQSYNPFQSWTTPPVSGLGAGNQFYFLQQGNMPYSYVSSL